MTRSTRRSSGTQSPTCRRRSDGACKQSLAYSLRPVINATGVILHTNLGRAPLAAAALEHTAEVAQGIPIWSSIWTTGERGKRDVHVDRLFAPLLKRRSAKSLPSWSTTTPPQCCWR